MITLHLEAESLDELKGMACRALSITLRDRVGPPRPFAPVSEATAIADADTAIAKRSVGRPPKERAKRPEPQPEPIAGSFEELVEAIAEPAPEEDFVVDMDPPEEPAPEPEYVEVPVPSGDATAEAVALEKLKAETMILIQDMFAAGKVKHIRAVLDKHGGGAKSFPEIEAKEFPVINAALREAA